MAGRFVCEAVTPALVCAVCSKPFTPSQRGVVCCSRKCGWVLGKARSVETRAARAAEERRRTCRQCGVNFSVKRASGKPGEGQYCGRRCAADARRVVRLRPPPLTAWCERCGCSYQTRTPSQRWCSEACRASASSIAKAAYACIVCLTAFAYEKTGGRPKRVCSEQCSREADRSARKIARVKRKQRMASTCVETVHAARVFARDGWRCQHCGARTPQSLRATWNDRAPELDHIVPLSRGGEHSYRNTQLLCRACNIAKGAGPGGQLRLFG